MNTRQKILATVAGVLTAGAVTGAAYRMVRNYREKATMRRAINKLKAQGNWQIVKGRLQRKYGQLTDDDLTMAYGREKEFIGNLSKKLGKSVEDTVKEIEKI